MGKPRLIVIIRHAQSEGNKNKAIHQTVPDHRVKLTSEGTRQAVEAGERLLKLLRPEDTLQIITSPYLRTRETAKGIVSQLSSHPNSSKIKVYEEPRIREQDFGNFQPCTAEMERMWHERAAYGHFFYRIPNGESAADAYDRVSGFNESLWRQFAEEDFPSVLVLVTHGLMTRIFLMKWYHYSVEYFEDLKNVDHCQFVLMEKNPDTDKYELKTKLRTWSAERKKEEERQQREGGPSAKDLKKLEAAAASSKVIYGGCVNGCNHGKTKPKTNGLTGFSNGESESETAQDLRNKLAVLQAGRDFGGSRSGAGSRTSSDDESGSADEEMSKPSDILSYLHNEQSSEPSELLENLIRRDMQDHAQAELLGDVLQEDGGVRLWGGAGEG
ncbi:phosphoglycerate mutase-like protein [Choiromyces venosus 120613-1]|uniref:Phosphoglycerate mutase-like protein n=1 Tax=Choiromyces venosus 120613-1 TaxID=1336337 RepID=A0A3N4IYV3_9PEZI|nr:phosphoglycerate mutase-like protein [Choiromyces venosus 120613-1]